MLTSVSHPIVQRSFVLVLLSSLGCSRLENASVQANGSAGLAPVAVSEPASTSEGLLEGLLSAPPSPPPPRVLRDADISWDLNPVMQQLGRIEASMTESQYTYGFSVNERKGIFNFDCSGMAYWVLKKATPRAAAALAYELEHRPLARDIYRRIASVPVDSPRYGWQRVARVDALEPGDVVAWIKPTEIQSPNTGHVGFVVLPPARVPGSENAYLSRFADSTRLLHDDDTRQGRNGFGRGTLLLVSDPETGAPIAYGWRGLAWRSFETKIALGRPLE